MPIGGSTPLLFAARAGNVESARLLLDAGADLRDTAADGNVPLVMAAHSGHATLAAFLLERGAGVDAAPLGYTALHAAVLRGVCATGACGTQTRPPGCRWWRRCWRTVRTRTRG